MKSLPNITLTLCGKEWFGNIERVTYQSGNAGLEYIDSHGDSIAMLSVNPHDVELKPDFVAIKNYSENEGVLSQLIALKIVKPSKWQLPSGHVMLPVCRIIHPTLLDQPPLSDSVHVGWPGDGTGEDDFADHNQNEADDYRNE